jgi:hypothetical protein
LLSDPGKADLIVLDPPNSVGQHQPSIFAEMRKVASLGLVNPRLAQAGQVCDRLQRYPSVAAQLQIVAVPSQRANNIGFRQDAIGDGLA